MPSRRTVSWSSGSTGPPAAAAAPRRPRLRSKTSPASARGRRSRSGSPAGSNQTTLPCAETSAPQVEEYIATIPSPRPTVASSRSSSVMSPQPRRRRASCRGPRPAGGSACRRARTMMGGSACRIALVTSSETPSSAASLRSSRPSAASSPTTQARAARTDCGSGSSSRVAHDLPALCGARTPEGHQTGDHHRDVEDAGHLLQHDDAAGVTSDRRDVGEAVLDNVVKDRNSSSIQDLLPSPVRVETTGVERPGRRRTGRRRPTRAA